MRLSEIDIQLIKALAKTPGEPVSREILAKSGDMEMSERNIDVQIASNSFQQTLSAAQQSWRQVMQTFDISLPSSASSVLQQRRKTFLTAVFHAHSAPTNYTEPGEHSAYHMGMDGKVHNIDSGHAWFSDLSIWVCFFSFFIFPIISFYNEIRTFIVHKHLCLH